MTKFVNWQPSLTPSFKPPEMACRCKKCDGYALMDHNFMLKLQAMRDQLGPMTVTSGYRCPEHPAEKRKERSGSHAQGMAADITINVGKQRFNAVSVALSVGMVGIGVASSFIHVDSGHQHADRPALWKY
jgi:uncharacterized protein YcbK (DUF882 family)